MTVASFVLAAAAIWELVGSRGESGVATMRRRFLRRRRGPEVPIGLESLLDAEAEHLRDAGLEDRIPAGAVLTAKATSAVLAIPAALVAAPVAPGRFGAVILIAVPVAAFLAPDLLLERAARARRSRLNGALPDVLDLMATGAATGRGIGALLDDAMRSASGPLREELARTVAAIECGGSKELALRALGERSRGSTLAGLAASLERSRRHGSPLSRTLHELAGSLRGDQRRQIMERAARAAPQMQLVVALLLVPSVLLIVAAAIVANSGSLLPSF